MSKDEMLASRVFVYGTLLSGLSNHRVMKEAGGVFLQGEVRTVEGWGLVNLGHYPAMVRQKTGTVKGEIYAVSQEGLFLLHGLEGVRHGFYRYEPVRLEDGSEVMAYTMTHRLKELKGRGYRRIPRGDWRGFFRWKRRQSRRTVGVDR